MLVKQVPRFENIHLDARGHMIRQGVEMEINPYCRRAISKGVELAQTTGGECITFALGPAGAGDVLKEALAWGSDSGVLISDPAFAGSDTLATARALAGALSKQGPFDLILAGLNSVDSDTGQVPPEVAELLDLPFAAAVRELKLADDTAEVVLRQDNISVEASVSLPCVLSVTERLCAPAKKPPEERRRIADDKITHLRAYDLGPGPWGEAASPTRVDGLHRVEGPQRLRRMLGGPLECQVQEAVALLRERGALARVAPRENAGVVLTGESADFVLCVLVDPYSPQAAPALCAEAARLASELGATVTAVTGDAAGQPSAAALASWGADSVLRLRGVEAAEDFSEGLKPWMAEHLPWAVFAPSSVWGREVSARLACHLNAGLTGDAVALELNRDQKLTAWKPTLGGNLLAAITTRTPVQMVTLRRGALPVLTPRDQTHAKEESIDVPRRHRIRIRRLENEDDVEPLLSAHQVIGIGQSVPRDEMASLKRLRAVLSAEIAATRKVTDKGWLPRARQVGVTGNSIAPNLYLAVGISGKFNHTVGIQSSKTILAINNNPKAPIFETADIGIVADWREVVPLIAQEINRVEEKPA